MPAAGRPTRPERPARSSLPDLCRGPVADHTRGVELLLPIALLIVLAIVSYLFAPEQDLSPAAQPGSWAPLTAALLVA